MFVFQDADNFALKIFFKNYIAYITQVKKIYLLRGSGSSTIDWPTLVLKCWHLYLKIFHLLLKIGCLFVWF